MRQQKEPKIRITVENNPNLSFFDDKPAWKYVAKLAPLADEDWEKGLPDEYGFIELSLNREMAIRACKDEAREAGHTTILLEDSTASFDPVTTIINLRPSRRKKVSEATPAPAI